MAELAPEAAGASASSSGTAGSAARPLRGAAGPMESPEINTHVTAHVKAACIQSQTEMAEEFAERGEEYLPFFI